MYVFPLPVWPYANMQELYPAKQFSTIGCPVTANSGSSLGREPLDWTTLQPFQLGNVYFYVKLHVDKADSVEALNGTMAGMLHHNSTPWKMPVWSASSPATASKV